jgi:hypothetical protein
MEYPSGHDELDGLLWQAGRTHVIPHREDPDLLERLREPRAASREPRALACALRFRDVPEAAEALEAVRAHHARLPEAERRWLEENAPDLLQTPRVEGT